MMNVRSVAIVLAIALVVVVGGAGIYMAVSSSSDSGRISIYVKDLPAEWTHVNITFSEVKIHKANSGNDSGWQTLPMRNQTLDLASLTNVSALLATGNVDAGKYTQIRLVVVSAVGTMANGTIVNFTVPSGELKTTHPFNVTSGHTETLTLDFDLSKSIIHTGSGWKFKPVLGSVVEN